MGRGSDLTTEGGADGGRRDWRRPAGLSCPPPPMLRRRLAAVEAVAELAGLGGTTFSRPTRGIIDFRPIGGRDGLLVVPGLGGFRAVFPLPEVTERRRLLEVPLFVDDGIAPIVIRRFGVRIPAVDGILEMTSLHYHSTTLLLV